MPTYWNLRVYNSNIVQVMADAFRYIHHPAGLEDVDLLHTSKSIKTIELGVKLSQRPIA